MSGGEGIQMVSVQFDGQLKRVGGRFKVALKGIARNRRAARGAKPAIFEQQPNIELDHAASGGDGQLGAWREEVGVILGVDHKNGFGRGAISRATSRQRQGEIDMNGAMMSDGRFA